MTVPEPALSSVTSSSDGLSGWWQWLWGGIQRGKCPPDCLEFSLAISSTSDFILPFFFLFLFWLPYGTWSSQARGQGSDPSHSCDLCCSCSQRHRSFNPRCWAEDGSCILALQRCCQSHCATVGTPLLILQGNLSSL